MSSLRKKAGILNLISAGLTFLYVIGFFFSLEHIWDGQEADGFGEGIGLAVAIAVLIIILLFTLGLVAALCTVWQTVLGVLLLASKSAFPKSWMSIVSAVLFAVCVPAYCFDAILILDTSVYAPIGIVLAAWLIVLLVGYLISLITVIKAKKELGRKD
ncbi:MAG: hypothetical protein KBS76_00975 [Ruminococcus sp.]|nr:hypothetical protein [Candidatus Apopatosoma intestinale]